MSLKLKSFNNFSNVLNVNQNDKKNSAPICIDLDDDSNDKTDESNDKKVNDTNVVKSGCGDTLSTSRELILYHEDDDPSIYKEDNENDALKDGLHDSVIVVDNNGVALVLQDCLNNSVIVVDNDGIATIVQKQVDGNKEFSGKTESTPSSDEQLKDPDDTDLASKELAPNVNSKTNVAPTIVLEEDNTVSPGDVVQVHEISVDGDIVQVHEIALDDKVSDETKSIYEKDINHPLVLHEDACESLPDTEETDEIVIISDEFFSAIDEQKSKDGVANEKTNESSLSKISENVTVIKNPLQRTKKNKRMIKSPFKRGNDLLCQKVDKMIRIGEPDIQLLRTLLNHLSENKIGQLLAKLVSSEELETICANIETIGVKDETIGIAEDSKAADNEQTDDDISLQKKAVDVCSKLPDGITIAVVSTAKVDDKEGHAKKVVNSVDMIDTIIQSELTAAESAKLASGKQFPHLNVRSDSVVELDVTPPPSPDKVPLPVLGGIRITNIKNLLAPKEDIIIPEVPKQSTIRISGSVSLSKHSEDDDISIIEENLSPATITRNLPNVSISRSLPPQPSQSRPPPPHSRNTSSHPPAPPNTYYDGRGKLRSSLSHKLVRLTIDPPQQAAMPIPMNELIRRYLYPSGTGGVSVGTLMENPWGLPRDLAMYEELLRTNMTTTTDNSQYAAYAAAYEELIKSYMSSSPENYARIVAKYNIFSTERPHSDHNRPSTSRMDSGQGLPDSAKQQTSAQTSSSSLGHQRTPVIVSAASLRSKAQYKECSLGPGVTLAPVLDREREVEPQPGPSGVRERSIQRSGKKRSYKESSEESSDESSDSEEDEPPSPDEFVVEQAETDRMKAGRSKRRETDMSKRRRKSSKEVVRSREDGAVGVCSKRRVKVTAMRHNPVRKGQVTVDSTDSEDNSESAKRRRAMKAFKEARKQVCQEGRKLRGSDSDGGDKSKRQLFCEEASNSGSDRGAVPRKTNINRAALKINRIESDSNESWKKDGSGSSQEDVSTEVD